MRKQSLKTNERIAWVDVLKFLGILFIYIGHYGEPAGLLYKYVFQFHVPLFFFISGFFFKNEDEIIFKDFIIKKFKKYMIPYFLLNVVYIIVCCLLNNFGVTFVLKHFFEMILGIRNNLLAGSTWFIPCLFVLEIIYFLLNKICKRKKKILLGISLVLYILFVYFMPTNPIINPSWFWNVDSAMVYLIYFSIGNFIFEYIIDFKKNTRKRQKFIYLLFLGLILVVNAICFFKTRKVMGTFLIGPHYFLFDIAITIFLISLWVVVSFVLEDFKLLYSIGQNTLYLCLTENLIKVLLINLLAVFGITLNLSNSFVIICYCFLIIIVNSKIFIPFLKKIGKLISKKIENMVIM